MLVGDFGCVTQEGPSTATGPESAVILDMGEFVWEGMPSQEGFGQSREDGEEFKEEEKNARFKLHDEEEIQDEDEDPTHDTRSELQLYQVSVGVWVMGGWLGQVDGWLIPAAVQCNLKGLVGQINGSYKSPALCFNT